MPGFGVSAAAISPFGFGTPVGNGSVPEVGPAGSRYISPATGDYAQDAVTGQLQQMPPLRQRVLLAVRTIQGSSTSVPGFGIRPPRKMGTTFVADMIASVRKALYQLTDVEKVLVVESVDVVRGGGGRSVTTITYTDVGTGDTGQRVSFNNG